MSRSNFKVSVVIPTYNRPAILGPTLDAILGQTVPPAEVIVIDDGSRESYREIVAKYPIRYHRIENSGLGIARNTGAGMAQFPWIAFCDDDDLWRPNYLATAAAALGDNGFYSFSNFVFVREGAWTNEDKFSAAPRGYFETPDEPLYPKLLRWMPIFPSAIVMKKTFFDGIGGFNPRFSKMVSGDLDFLLRSTEVGNVTVIPEPLVGIRKHATNRSSNVLAALLGDLSVLRWARTNHRLGREHGAIIDDEIARRSLWAFDAAFTLGRKELVVELAGAVPDRCRNAKFGLKLALARNQFVPPAILAKLFGRANTRRV